MCSSCEQRLKSCDDAFRHQLEAKQKAHDSHVTKIVAEKDQEIAQAHQKVSELEIIYDFSPIRVHLHVWLIMHIYCRHVSECSTFIAMTC